MGFIQGFNLSLSISSLPFCPPQEPEDFDGPDIDEVEKEDLINQWRQYPLPSAEVFEGGDESTPNIDDYLNVRSIQIFLSKGSQNQEF